MTQELGKPRKDILDIRLECIADAVERKLEPKDDWADWLRDGVQRTKLKLEVNKEWLIAHDNEKSYI